MYDYKINDDDVIKIKNIYNENVSDARINDLVDKIKNIDDSFGFADIPEYVEPNLTRMDDVVVDADSIRSSAIESLSDYKNKSIQGIEEDYSSSVDKLNAKKEKLDDTLAVNKNNVSAYYDEARLRASNDALDRGLARSSIVVNVLDAFDNNEISELNQLDREYSSSINAIDFELASLDLRRKKALSDFDISYAVKLGDKISSLTKELEQKQSEVIKFNNDIAEKEKKYLDNYNDLVASIKKSNTSANQKMVDLVGKYGEKAVNRYRKSLVSDALDKYFAGMDNSQIIDILSNNTKLRNVLGGDIDEYVSRYSNGVGTNS